MFRVFFMFMYSSYFYCMILPTQVAFITWTSPDIVFYFVLRFDNVYFTVKLIILLVFSSFYFYFKCIPFFFKKVIIILWWVYILYYQEICVYFWSLFSVSAPDVIHLLSQYLTPPVKRGYNCDYCFWIRCMDYYYDNTRYIFFIIKVIQPSVMLF